jgi:hypothetical protein
MLSRRSFFERILANREARELLMNSLAVGEADSAIGLDRASEHVEDPVLSRKIYRHYAEEKKHARLFGRRLEALGVEAKPLPPDLDYEGLVRRFEMGTPQERYDDPRPFDQADLIRFLVGCKAGEERACAEMHGLIQDFKSVGIDAETIAVLEEIYGDEIRHVSYATEELNRIAAKGPADREEVVTALRRGRRAEARAHRIVSRTFLARLMTLAGVPGWIRFFAGIAIDVQCTVRFLFPGGLDQPLVADPMPVPPPR